MNPCAGSSVFGFAHSLKKKKKKMCESNFITKIVDTIIYIAISNGI